MKLFYAIWTCLILFIFSSALHGQDLLFLEGKHTPMKGRILSKGQNEIGADGRLTFVRANTTRGKEYKYEKIALVLTQEKQLFIEPGEGSNIRDLSKMDYGIIFLNNGNSIAIKNWEVIGADGKIEYEDFFSGNIHELSQDQYVAIYTLDPDLQLYGDLPIALSRLKTAFLPQVPTPPSDVLTDNSGGSEGNISSADPDVELSDDFQVEEEDGGASPDRIDGPAMPINMDDFNDKAKAKVEKFASYVKTILEGEDRMRIRSVIDQAMILFVSDTCFIEVSSLNRDRPIAYKIRRYFNRLNYLADKYTKIEITNGQVVKVSDIRKYKDTWYGTVTYGQRFSGYKDGQLVYTDYTQKNINIILKVYEPEIEGESKAIWDVLLSNISVTETSK